MMEKINWNQKLEQYDLFSAQMEIGRQYAEAGAVTELRIEAGQITAKVQDIRKQPYKVTILVDLLSKRQQEQIYEWYCRKTGKRQQMSEILVPQPKEMYFACSCPDWGYLCSHAATVLYEAGNQMEQELQTLLILRGLEPERMDWSGAEQVIQAMFAEPEKKTKRVMEEEQIRQLFGIDI